MTVQPIVPENEAHFEGEMRCIIGAGFAVKK
jgi:hypothetical protein